MRQKVGRKGEGIGWDGGPRCRCVKRWPKQKGKLSKITRIKDKGDYESREKKRKNMVEKSRKIQNKK